MSRLASLRCVCTSFRGGVEKPSDGESLMVRLISKPWVSNASPCRKRHSTSCPSTLSPHTRTMQRRQLPRPPVLLPTFPCLLRMLRLATRRLLSPVVSLRLRHPQARRELFQYGPSRRAPSALTTLSRISRKCANCPAATSSTPTASTPSCSATLRCVPCASRASCLLAHSLSKSRMSWYAENGTSRACVRGGAGQQYHILSQSLLQRTRVACQALSVRWVAG